MILAEPVGGGDPRQTTETSSDPHAQKFAKAVTEASAHAAPQSGEGSPEDATNGTAAAKDLQNPNNPYFDNPLLFKADLEYNPNQARAEAFTATLYDYEQKGDKGDIKQLLDTLGYGQTSQLVTASANLQGPQVNRNGVTFAQNESGVDQVISKALRSPGVQLQSGYAAGQATVDAAKTRDTSKLTGSLAEVQQINAAIKADGGKVTDSQYLYLWTYYDGTANNSAAIDNAIKADASLRATAGAQYADGLLNLSRGAEQTSNAGTNRGGLNGLPPTVLSVLNSRIGEKGATPKDGTTDSSGGPQILRAVWKSGQWEIPNYANDTGFGDLLSYADKDVAGGSEFTQQLASTAINWKQDIDAIKQNTNAWGQLQYTGLPGEDEWGDPPLTGKASDTWNLPINDTGSSGLLTAASHNQPASTQILLDADDRHAILGLPWQGQGAADLIGSGTAPDPTGKTQRNQAALAVIQDTGSDYQDFAKIVSNPVKGALTELALTHLASFGDQTGVDSTSGVGSIPVPNGQIQGLSLNNTDASNFLKMLSLSGPKYAGIVHAAALDLGAKWLQAGGAGQAVTLIGRVSSSEYAAAVDKAVGLSGREQTAYIGEIRQEQQEAQKQALQTGILDGIQTVVDIGTLGASDKIQAAAGAFTTVLGGFQTTQGDLSAYADAGSISPNQARLIEIGQQVQQALKQPQQSAQLSVDVDADLDYAALKAAGYKNPTIAYNAQAGQWDSIVKPARDRYYGGSGNENSLANHAIDTMLAAGSGTPRVNWTAADIRRAVNGGDNEVYQARLDSNWLASHLVDATPK